MASFTAFIGSLLLGLVGLKQPWGAGSGGPVWYWVRSHLKAVLAGGMAYAYYVAAALVAGAEFPKFLQEHLFDGLAPAALIAGLIDLYDRRDPAHAYRKLPVPGTILLMLFAVSAVFFALIGAAAVLGSETNNYLPAVLVTAAYGGEFSLLLTGRIRLAKSQVTQGGRGQRGGLKDALLTRGTRRGGRLSRSSRRPGWRSSGAPPRRLGSTCASLKNRLTC